MNNKGFTLVELLITITILGIVLAFSIAIVNNITVKNKSQTYQIYSDSLLQSSKVYNDSYAEDTFGNREYGCTKVPYSTLKQKDLISNMTVKGAQCGYMVDTNKDSSGVIIRKVKDKYYYETFLYCKDEGAENNKDNDYVKGGVKEYFSELDEDYCNTTATKDNEPPTIHYRNVNIRTGHFYNKKNLPKPQVKITDSGVGLNNVLDVNYDWDSKKASDGRKTIELLRFTTRKGAGTTRWKDIPLSPKLTSPDHSYKEYLQVSPKNIEDLANNVTVDNIEDVTTLKGHAYKDNVSGETGRFYVDIKAPIIKRSNNVKWRNTSFSIWMYVQDPVDYSVRSGIKSVTYTLSNEYTTSSGNEGTWTITSDAPPRNNNGNYSAAAGGSSSIFKQTITIDKPGNYKLHVRVEDWAGNVTEDNSGFYQFDDIKPTCGAQSPSNPGWTNKNREITIGCSDQANLSGCKQERYSKTFGESYTGSIKIYDYAGNSTTCPVTTKVDKTKPNCTSRGGSDTWRTAPLTIYGDCTDQGTVRSGCRQTTYSKIYSGNVKTKYGYGGTAYDNAGNSRDCTKNQTVHIDNEPPTCNGVNKTTTYSANGVSGKVKCKDNYSGCQSQSYSFSGIKSSRTIAIKDNIGHTTNCNVSVNSTTCGSGNCLEYGYNRSSCYWRVQDGHTSERGCTTMEGGEMVRMSDGYRYCCPPSAKYCIAYDTYTCYY